MKYDDGEWHYESTPEALSDDERWDRAVAHIAVYLRCCMMQGWLGDLHIEDDEARLAARQAIASNITVTKFFIEYCDCKLTNEDLNDEGNAFTNYYYDTHYTNDVEPCIDGEFFDATEAQYDYAKYKEVFDRRYAEWLANGRPSNDKPWWKFW